ncbi:hypothetical protein ACLKA7_000825 [Drosophila subpalustris]
MKGLPRPVASSSSYLLYPSVGFGRKIGCPNVTQTRPPGQIRRQKTEQTEIPSTNRIQVFPGLVPGEGSRIESGTDRNSIPEPPPEHQVRPKQRQAGTRAVALPPAPEHQEAAAAGAGSGPIRHPAVHGCSGAGDVSNLRPRSGRRSGVVFRWPAAEKEEAGPSTAQLSVPPPAQQPPAPQPPVQPRAQQPAPHHGGDRLAI